MAVLSSGSGAVVVRCRDRAGSRESMVAGACGGCNGCGRSGHGKAAYPCTQSMPQGTPACRIGTGPQRTGSLRSLLCARMAAAKKACAPFGDTGRKSRLVKGSLRGKPSRIDSRDATGWRPQAVPVATQEATGIDSRDATGWRPQAVPVATQEATGIDSRDATGWRPQAVPVSEKNAARDHRQRGGGPKTQRRWRYGPDGHRWQDAPAVMPCGADRRAGQSP